MTGSDARRFDFCVRCLDAPDAANPLTEHHTEGRASHRNQMVFICDRCHVDLHRAESQHDPAYAGENAAMLQKTRMLVSSRSLRLVIANRRRIADGFATRNRNGVSINIGPKGVEFSGPFGAVGQTGRRFYFVPSGGDAVPDDNVDVYDCPDGIGGVGAIGTGTGGWVRFRGDRGGILATFIAAHRRHVGIRDTLDGIEQD